MKLSFLTTTLCYAVIKLILSSELLYASSQPSEATHYFLESLNEPSTLETAAAHGAYGFTLGAGLLSIEDQNLDRSLNAEAQESAQLSFDGAKVNIPKIWISKGIFWPLDIGISFGYRPENNINQFSSYMQWSVFERFGLPAFSVRGSFSQTGFNRVNKIKSVALESIGSWGYGPVSIFAAYGLMKSESDIDIKMDRSIVSEGLAVNAEEQKNPLVTYSSSSALKHVGIQLQFFSLLRISIERNFSSKDAEVIAVKMSIGM